MIRRLAGHHPALPSLQGRERSGASGLQDFYIDGLLECSPSGRSRSFLDQAVLARLAGFPLLPRRPMQGNVSGRHPSPHRGSSVEFAEYRKYVPGTI